jgi:hypothetical protein
VEEDERKQRFVSSPLAAGPVGCKREKRAFVFFFLSFVYVREMRDIKGWGWFLLNVGPTIYYPYEWFSFCFYFYFQQVDYFFFT